MLVFYVVCVVYVFNYLHKHHHDEQIIHFAKVHIFGAYCATVSLEMHYYTA